MVFVILSASHVHDIAYASNAYFELHSMLSPEMRNRIGILGSLIAILKKDSLLCLMAVICDFN